MAGDTTAEQLIAVLGLEPLPREGGWFRPTWRSRTGSAIFFLLRGDEFSALHRLEQDEIWHFYAGDPVAHVQIDPADGSRRLTRMGPDVLGGERPQLHVPAGVWQGAKLGADLRTATPGPRDASAQGEPHPAKARHGYALLGCTLAPPWDERAFTLGARAELLRAFPASASWITALTR